MPEKFLKTVADYYCSSAPGVPRLENLVFILPNKRSIAFLKKYIQGNLDGPARMPRFMSVKTFASALSGAATVSDSELTFLLYSAYTDVMNRRGRTPRSFDSFVFWSTVILEDFDNIDRFGADADALFENLRRHKEITADFLSDEQKELVRRIWGESRLTAEGERFWLHAAGVDDDSLSAMMREYVSLWDILGELYHELKKRLEETSAASPGLHFRRALERVRDMGADDFPAGVIYVMVGFNDLSTTEFGIFRRLKDLGKAQFFWDLTPCRFFADDMHCDAIRRVMRLAETFPAPEGYTIPEDVSTPAVRVIASPSQSEQAKITGAVLEQWGAGCSDINTAVVMPDQSMLMPMLFSIPGCVDSVNISMQLEYRSTNFATLFSHILRLQLRAREIRGRMCYFYEDVRNVLTHPHISAIAGEDAAALMNRIERQHLYNIGTDLIAENFPELSPLFANVRALDSVEAINAYFNTLIQWLSDKLREAGSSEGFEVVVLEHLAGEIDTMATLAQRYTVDIAPVTFVKMVERYLATRGLAVKGTPLKGLQILGVLETRALNFDRLVIMSMNDGKFPPRSYSPTMIPNSIRYTYGLPSLDNLELTYAYSFFRLIAGAREVVLVYDGRGGSSAKEMSRYISQIRYLMPVLAPRGESWNTMGAAPQYATDISLPKCGEVMARLDKFRAGGPLNMSASALKTWIDCPLRFYLQYACGYRDMEEPVSNLSAADYGTIIHNTIQGLFDGHEGKHIDAAFYDAVLADDAARVRKMAEKTLRENTGAEEFNTEFRNALNVVTRLATITLQNERDSYCADGRGFTFLKNELKIAGPWRITDDISVNWKMSIDRVDRPDSPEGMLRFIDFKTGSDNTGAKKLETLVSDYNNHGILQLLAYSQAYIDIIDSDAQIRPFIEAVRSLQLHPELKPVEINGVPVDNYATIRDEFEPMIKNIIAEIFDPELPVKQCDNTKGCKYCPFNAGMCRRKIDKY